MGQLENLMRLGMTKAEAEAVLADDKDIDRGKKKDFDLTKEQIKATREYRQAERKPTVYDFSKRERKPNEEKRMLIEVLRAAVDGNAGTDIEVTNIERQIDFKFNGTRYRIVLSAPRKQRGVFGVCQKFPGVFVYFYQFFPPRKPNFCATFPLDF